MDRTYPLAWLRAVLAAALLICSWSAAASLRAATGAELQESVNQMVNARLDDSSVFTIQSTALTCRDMHIFLDSGTIVLLAPVRLDSVNLRYGALFEGRGRMQFRPALSMERQQLHRFLSSDSLNRSFTSVLLLFDTATCSKLLAKTTGQAEAPRDCKQTLSKMLKYLNEERSRYYFYRTLLHLLQPGSEPYLLTLGAVSNSDELLFLYDPFDREQIGLQQRQMQVVYRYVFQTICSYALEAEDRTGEYNGHDRSPLDVYHYDIDAHIDRGGKLTAAARLDFTVRQQPTRVIDFFLDPEMKVDSVHDAAGHTVAFSRFKDSDHYYGLWLLLDSAMQIGDSSAFTFYYSGDVAGMELGQYYVFAGASWYPRHNIEHLRATYHMRLKSPADYNLVATGRLVDSVKHRDTLVTTWQVDRPARNVSFNIGLFKKYDFYKAGEKPLQMLFSEDLHRWFGSVQGVSVRPTARHVERQVADDIQQSLKLYAEYFGPCPFDTIVVSEILQFASEAYPGFVHLSFISWITTDLWGYNSLLRAHEVAHQWWGADVMPETYRDKWLSEGFAEYSALMYLQHAVGTKRFLDRIDGSRKLIMGERKNAGAVGLGIRTGNIKDKDNYLIVIYQKGAYVLHMLRYLLMDLQTMKDDTFLGLMREFHETYQGRYAGTHDFARLASTYAGSDLTWFFDQWVYNNYIPTYDCHYSVKSNSTGGVIVKLSIEQKEVPESFRMYLPIEIEYANGVIEYQRILVDKPVVEQELPLARTPRKIRFNPFHAVLAKVNQ